MSKPLVLTCDIGTQSARALLVDPDGRSSNAFLLPYPVSTR